MFSLNFKGNNKHNFIAKEEVLSLTFGIHQNESWSSTTLYRISQHRLECDTSETFSTERFQNNTYNFKGQPVILNETAWNAINSILNNIPKRCLEMSLPTINSSGNKEEYLIFIQIILKNQHCIAFKINEYDRSDLKTPKIILNFKEQIKATIKEIEIATT